MTTKKIQIKEIIIQIKKGTKGGLNAKKRSLTDNLYKTHNQTFTRQFVFNIHARTLRAGAGAHGAYSNNHWLYLLKFSDVM